jgi:hypothetical protein
MKSLVTRFVAFAVLAAVVGGALATPVSAKECRVDNGYGRFAACQS